MQKLTMIMGLPGSGKTTYSSKINGLKLHIDEIRKSITGSYIPSESNDLVHQVTQKCIYYHLSAGKSVILDGALLSKNVRSNYIRIAKNLKIPIDIYWIDLSHEKLSQHIIIRNKDCPKDRKIDLQYIESLSCKLEMPTIEEGFDNIFRISDQEI